MTRHLWIIVALLGLGAEAAAAPKDAESTRKQIEAVRGEIKALQSSITEDQQQKNDAQRVLGRLDREIAALASKVRTLDAQIVSVNERLVALSSQQQDIELRIEKQQDAIADLVVSGHRQGPTGAMKSALNQQDTTDLSRQMTYQKYLHQARQDKLAEFGDMLDALEQVKSETERELQTLAGLKTDLDRQREALGRKKTERQRAVASLSKALASKGERLNTLKSNQANLEAVLRRIQEAMARVGHFDSGTPITQQRGRLPWPAPGRILHAFGSQREGELRYEGVVIGSPEGVAVRSVHNGRVVFADWLRGYGMLVIVDHGGGFLSLYGNNQSLAVKPGATLKAGDVVAYSGNSGLDVSGAYFEIRQKGQPVNPSHWCIRK